VEQDDGSWRQVTGGAIDTGQAYLADLPEGRDISLFFYNGGLSHDIAFNGMLNDGRLLAASLVDAGREDGEVPHLTHVATDGETYGHHHRHGEMALAVALDLIEADPRASLTNYSQFLAANPARRKVGIVEDSSWSCAHGVERWRADCGCATGRPPTGHQRWRAPLRAALDWLRDELIGPFQEIGSDLLQDPWRARDAYIEVILGGSVDDFLEEYGVPGSDPDQAERAIELLEIQHRAMLMYTSCGWFFDDISGLEAVFVLRHAGRVAELSRRVLGLDLEPELMARLEAAPSNLEGKTGRDVYEAEVSPFVGKTTTG
jgi:alpha-amylase/alpha-mannosidase (GH57 family)